MNLVSTVIVKYILLNFNYLLSNRQSSLERKIPTASSNINSVIALLKLPLLRNNIPNTQITSSELESDFNIFSSLDGRLLKTTELLGRVLLAGNTDIQLRNFLTVDITSVADLDSNSSDNVPKVGASTLGESAGGILVRFGVGLEDIEIGVIKGSVAKTETEFVARSDVLSIK